MTHIGHSEKVLVMRVFVAVIVLIFSFQSLSIADSASDLIKAADDGDPIAQNNVGWNYLYGLNNFPEDL